MRKEVLNETKFIQEIAAVLPIVICTLTGLSIVLTGAWQEMWEPLCRCFSIRGCGIRIVDHYSQ